MNFKYLKTILIFSNLKILFKVLWSVLHFDEKCLATAVLLGIQNQSLLYDSRYFSSQC